MAKHKKKKKGKKNRKRSASAKRAYHKTGLYKLNQKRKKKAAAKKHRGGEKKRKRGKHRFSYFGKHFKKKKFSKKKINKRLERLRAHLAKKSGGSLSEAQKEYLAKLRRRLEITQAFAPPAPEMIRGTVARWN